MRKNKIIILCGKSAAGKDTIAQKLIDILGYEFIISTTSRPIRENEKEGDPYYFIKKEEFIKLIEDDELIEYREYNTLANDTPDVWYYGVPKASMLNSGNYIGVLDIVGLDGFKEHFGGDVLSFYIHVDDKERERRAIKRGGFDKAEWDRRAIDDNIIFSNDIISKKIDHVITNDSLNKAVINIIKKIDAS